MATRKRKPHAAKSKKSGAPGSLQKNDRSSRGRYKNDAKPSVVRVIGGQWRSRKLSFTAIDGLRPTTDRIRETLFNWLAPVVPGAKCLDLFAGSGALGLEALSRAAASVTFLDQSAIAIHSLKNNLQLLQATNAQVIAGDAVKWLETTIPESAYDIVFIDPPFRCDLVPACIAQLQQHPFLKTGSRIYIEIEKEAPLPDLPKNWSLSREKEAGQVRFLLFNTIETD